MAGITTVEQARECVGDAGGGTSAHRASMLYDWVREHRPEHVLELGFAHGVSTVYIAAALEANGSGTVTSVDNLSARERQPAAVDLLEKAGLTHRSELVYEQSSYNWFLHRTLRERTSEGVVEPLYDFCFLDGAHLWNVDGFAFFLVDLLLRRGGTILFDDLAWRPGPDAPEEDREVDAIQDVFDLLVTTNPNYDELATDGEWGWARKSPTGPVAVRTVIRRDGLGAVMDLARHVRSVARQRVGR